MKLRRAGLLPLVGLLTAGEPSPAPRTAPPAVDATAGAVTAAFANASAVDLSRVRLGFEGWPTCALYNGVGGPDWGDAVAAEPFDVALDAAGHATPVPVPACIAPCPVEGAPADCCGPQ